MDQDKPKQRNYSRELKNALVAGATVECAVAPYEGVTVLYRPRAVTDSRPWVLDLPWDRILPGFRCSGSECRVRVDGTQS